MSDTILDREPARSATGDRTVEVRPTVFVAVGGTGMEIVLRLRRRIMQTDWNGRRLSSLAEFPPAAFLYFDTDTNTGVESNKSQRRDPLSELVAFGPKESIQKKADLVYYRDEARHQANIVDWMPATDLSRINAEHGAGQVRAISRLLFFQEFKNIRASLIDCCQRVLQNVNNETQLRRLGIDIQANSVRIVVIASAAGGTGSGAFLDMGYLASSLRPAPQTDVDLFMMLPSGFQGANRARVFANGYAALSELEFCMRGDRRAPYVGSWTDRDRPEGVERPFKDVYLIDTKNVAGEITGDKDVVFDMVADILFEDFGNSDFARRKRSIGVNQQQFKMRPYAPRIGKLDSGTALSFYKGYSSLGQTTLNTTAALEFDKSVAEVTYGMIAAFFGILQSEKHNAVQAEERDNFLRHHLHLSSVPFQQIPTIAGRRVELAIAEFAVVDLLMLREDNTTVESALMLEIDRDIAGVKNNFIEHSTWSREIEHVYEQRKVDVDGRPGQQVTYGPRGEEIVKNRERLEAKLLGDGNDGLPAILYGLVDDHDRGGLDYTIDLIEEIAHAIEDASTGAVAKLAEAESKYARLSNDALNHNYVASLTRLAEASQRRLFSFGNGRDMAETILGQAQADVVDILRLRLRAIACREAQILLRNVCERLGRKQGADPTSNEPKGSGLVGEFLRGRNTVQRLLANVRTQITRVDDIIRRPDGGTFFTVKDRQVDIRTTDEELLEWGRQAFKGEGGSRSLFKRLADDKEQARIINILLEESNRRLQRHQPRIASCAEALRGIGEDARRELFEKMIERAMPWIDAKFDRDELKLEEEQYKLIIAVNEKTEFQREFGAQINACLPAGVGVKTVGYEETAIRGKIVCYCELSGIPLDIVAPLRSEWRRAYDEETNRQDAIPLHNHKDYEQFPTPVVPKSEELDRQKAQLELFLKGFMLGLLVRREDGDYRIQIRPNDWHRAGSERKIRRSNFILSQEAKLREQVRAAEDELSSAQVLAMAALSLWTADRAYAPRLVYQDKRETRVGGLAHHVALELYRDYLAKYRKRLPRFELDTDPEEAVRRLCTRERLDAWTEVLPGSLDDADPAETNRDEDDDASQRATDKRRVDPARFTQATIEALLTGAAPATARTAAPSPAPAFAPPPPPPPTASRFYLFHPTEGVKGPYEIEALAGLVAAGTLARDGLVCPEGQTTWVAASSQPALLRLFAPVGAPPPPPPPPPFA